MVSIIRVAKCSVPEICAELRAFGRFDEGADDSDAARFKKFKDIETALWLADHKQRQADKEAGITEAEAHARDKAAADAARAAITAIQEKELAEQKRGITKKSETGGTVPRADWAWSMSKAAPKKHAPPTRASGMGLSFQEIQKYDLYQLRKKMDECGLFETMHGAQEAYKACEELMAKLVKVLLDPTAKRVGVDRSVGQGATAAAAPVSKAEGNEKAVAALGGAADADAAGPEATVAASESTTTAVGDRSNELTSSNMPKVRRGEEITLENVPSLTLYELRQELERRGAFGDFLSKKKSINFNNMLKVMQSLLLSEKEARDAARAEEVWEKPEDIKARLARAKAERKAEALERSRLRQLERKKEEESAAQAAKAEEEETRETARVSGTGVMSAEAGEVPAAAEDSS